MTDATWTELAGSLAFALRLALFFGRVWLAMIVLGIRERAALRRKAREAWADHNKNAPRAPVVPLRAGSNPPPPFDRPAPPPNPPPPAA
jgi:hypothetical protein